MWVLFSMPCSIKSEVLVSNSTRKKLLNPVWVPFVPVPTNRYEINQLQLSRIGLRREVNAHPKSCCHISVLICFEL